MTDPSPALAARDQPFSLQNPAWLRWAIPLSLLACAAIMRLAGLDKSLWIDEAGSLAQARATDFIATARDYDHPPLYFAVLRAALHVTHSFTLLRLFSVACGLGAVLVFCFFFGDRARTAGWFAALLLAVSPGFVFNSQELRQYALLSLLFSIALACAWRVVCAPTERKWLIGLGGALAGAAGTHLITALFMASLAAVMGWSMRREKPPVLGWVAVALAPAAGFVLFFKTVFLLRTVKTPDQWWMPPVSPDLLRRVFSEDSGWTMLSWTSDAFNRHAPGSGSVFLVTAAMGMAFVGWTAWGRPHSPAHAWLAGALIYWGLMIGYSLVASPIVWPRTMLPGMMPFLLGLALGVTSHPRVRQRIAAMTILVLLAGAMMLPWLRGLAYQPAEDLRTVASTLRFNARPGDIFVLVNGVEVAIEPYWPAYKERELLKVELRDPPEATLSRWETARSHQSKGGTTFLIYRDDAYLERQRKALDRISAEMAAGQAPADQTWETSTYTIVRFGRTKKTPSQ